MQKVISAVRRLFRATDRGVEQDSTPRDLAEHDAKPSPTRPPQYEVPAADPAEGVSVWRL